jgi:hypothetical protein
MADEIITPDHLTAAYRSVFRSPGADLVLRDLGEFCHAATTAVVPGDIHQTLIHEGRREAFLRITKFIVLEVREMMALRAGRRTIEEDSDV